MQVYKDTDNNKVTPADVGATYISDERAAELGWTKVDADYEREATTEEMKRAELAAALADYNSTMEGIKDKASAALLDATTKDTKIAAAQTAATKAKTDYRTAIAAIAAKYK